MAFIVCRVTPHASAKSFCDMSFAALADFMRKFLP
jgi:hypothetical protein